MIPLDKRSKESIDETETLDSKKTNLKTQDNTQIVECPACRWDSPLRKLLYPCSVCGGKGLVSINKATWWELGMRNSSL